MTIKSLWLRRIHKWVGILVGLQFVLWALSGATMAILDMEAVRGGREVDEAAPALPPATAGWPVIQAAIGSKVTTLSTRTLLGRQLLEIEGSAGTVLVDPATGRAMTIGAPLAATIASEAHPGALAPKSVRRLSEVTLAVREHQLPIWQVDFDDAQHSSYYVSGTTGELLERRDDAWNWWDFAWMLHTMDYAKRDDFNHPLIVFAAIAMSWLAVTGFWLLFRTIWRHDAAWLRRRLTR